MQDALASSDSDISNSSGLFDEIRDVDDFFDKNKNELLRNWIRVSHLIDTINDNVLSLSMESSIDLFGGFRSILKELVLQSSNNMKLKSLYAILKQKNNEYQNANNSYTETKTTTEYTSLHLHQLPPELLSYICGYLHRNDITSFKMVSWGIAVVCLEEMSKISISILNANTLIMKPSIVEFTLISNYKKQQLIQISNEIKALKSRKFDLEFSALSASFEDQQNIKKQKAYLISSLKTAKRKEKSMQISQRIDTSCASFIQTKRMPLNTTFHDVFDRFGCKYNVPMQYQLIYHFGYPLRLFGSVHNENLCFSNEIQLSDVHHRKFIVFDKRNIFYLNESQIFSKQHTLVMLKYYDIETETLYFVGYLMIASNKVTIADIIQYLENEFVAHLCAEHMCKSNMNKWYHRLYCYLQRMDTDSVSKKLRMYRESRSMNGEQPGHVTHFINTLERILMNASIHCGDILIFQLNFVHCWFKHDIICEKQRLSLNKWYYKVDDWLLDQVYRFVVSVRQQNYYTQQYVDDLNRDNIKYYMETHLHITNECDLKKMLCKIEQCCVCLRINIAHSYCYGYIRKCISNSMDNVIKANNIHLYDVSNPNYAVHLPWINQWKRKKLQCQWSVVPWNTETAMITDDIEYRISAVKVYKPNQTPKPLYPNNVQFIVIKYAEQCRVKEMIQHVIDCMKHPLVEYKYKDIITSLNDGGDNEYNSFDFVLCVGDECLNAIALNERVCDYYNMDRSYILPMHLFIIPKANIELRSDEALLYIRFMFEPLKSGNKYHEVCCGFPIQCVIKKEDSLQSIIDDGKLTKYGVLNVLSCYRIKSEAEAQTRIKKKTVNNASAPTWHYYKPFERFGEFHPTDQIAMYVVIRNTTNVDNSEHRCVVGNCLF